MNNVREKGNFILSEKTFRIISVVSGTIALLCGSLIIAGWLTGTEWLTTFGLGPIKARPNMALCISLSGLSLLLLQSENHLSTFIVRILALLILFIGIATIAEHTTGADFGIDGLLLGLKHSDETIRISVLNSIVVSILGFTLMLVLRRNKKLTLLIGINIAVIFISGFFIFITFLLGLDHPEDYYGFSTASAIVSLMIMAIPAGIVQHILKFTGLKITPEKQLIFGLASAAAIILLVTIHSIERAALYSKAQEQKERTLYIQHSLNYIMSDILDIQSGTRGYILSSSDRYLLPVYDAIKNLPRSLSQLDSLMKMENNGVEKAEKLKAYIDERVRIANEVIGTARNFGMDSAKSLFATGYGKLVTDSIRSIIFTLDNQAHREMLVRKEVYEKLTARSKGLILLSLVIQIILLYSIWRVVTAAIRTRQNSINEIKKLNEELESKVEQRTHELRQSEMKYKYLFENSPLPMFIFDTETLSFLEVNDAATELYGYSREEFLSLTLKDIRPAGEKPQMLKYLSDPDQSASGRYLRHMKKNGEVFHVEFFANPLSIRGRKARFVLVNDITIQKQAEERIKQMNESLEERVEERTKQLEAANRAKSEFLTNMSHEIRTPMNAILGYSELLGSIAWDRTQLNYLESIKTSGRTLLTLINDILDLSKIEADRLDLSYDYVDTSAFFSEFGRIFSLKVAEKKLDFRIDVSPEIHGFIYIDEARLRQVILNLLGNAVKFTEKGSISLTVYCENRKYDPAELGEQEIFDLLIEVRDTGLGIPAESQEAIFDSFVQVRNRLNRGGTGLGLAISRRLVNLMKGTITVDSRVEEGSLFTVRIPGMSYVVSHERRKAPERINPEGIVFDEAVIMVVDDVESNRQYIRDILTPTRLTVLEADNGKSAWQLALHMKPDLVITDIRMPEMNGYDLLEKIRSDGTLSHIPVVAYSASVMKEQREMISRSDFSGLLIKPLRIEDLYAQLMRHLKFARIEVKEEIEGTAENAGDEVMSDLPGLIMALEGDLAETCRTFESRQPIAGVRDFGNNLIALGLRHNSGLIRKYGEELREAADTFNIEAMLKLIRSYQERVEKIRTIYSKS